jgi:uncharacterized damage-inducible protein DinB
MRSRVPVVAALLVALGIPLGAQERQGVMGDLLRDIDQLEKKIVGLARAMPDSAWKWTPGTGVRSTQETLMHVAADNYFLPAALGSSVPPETSIDAKDFKTTIAFEKRTRTRDEALAELEKSFAFLKKAMTGFADEKLDAPFEAFGQKMSNRALWIATVTHLHEHLGQLIAYARSNDVTPPWSK